MRLFITLTGLTLAMVVGFGCTTHEPDARPTTATETYSSSEYIVAAGRVPNAFAICWRGLQFLYNEHGGMVQVRTPEDKPMECKE